MIAAVRGWLAVCQVKQEKTWNIVPLQMLEETFTFSLNLFILLEEL